MEEPLVSIIIPTFNRAHLIGDTLDSVLAQTYTNWECIVVDDGSTDNTDEVLKTYCDKDARFKYVHRPDTHKPGGNGARNYGFKVSKGDYVTWLDSDDVFGISKLDLQLQELITTQSKICVSNAEFFIEKPEDSPKNLWSVQLGKQKVIDALIAQKTRWANGALLYDRNCIINWNEDLLGGQEWLFHILMALKEKQSDFCFTDDVVVYIRNSNTSMTRKASKIKRFNNYLNARILLLNDLHEHHPQLFERYFAETYKYSLKYIKYLVDHNNFKMPKRFSRLILKQSLYKWLYFWLAILIYKIFKKDVVLKN